MITRALRGLSKSDASLAARPIIAEPLPVFACVVFLLMTGASPALSGSASATIQKGKITDPSVAAQRLYNAWKKRSKKAALKVASPGAVSKLFSVKWRTMKFTGCQNTGGSFECIYHDAKNDLDVAMIIEGGASAGYHVESLSFSSEAAFLPFERNEQPGRVMARTRPSWLASPLTFETFIHYNLLV